MAFISEQIYECRTVLAYILYSEFENYTLELLLHLRDQWVNFMYDVLYHHMTQLNTLRPRQDGWQFAEDIFKCIFLNVERKN